MRFGQRGCNALGLGLGLRLWLRLMGRWLWTGARGLAVGLVGCWVRVLLFGLWLKLRLGLGRDGLLLGWVWCRLWL